MKQTNEKTSVSAATQEENAAHSTVFDDVFRTIAQKLPQLLIPLINEVFHTNYSEDEDFEQLRNEHYEKYGKIITDSIIRIGRHIYHLECQSQKDSEMVIRMFEYDISIALEHASDSDEIWEIEFPQSCVVFCKPFLHKIAKSFCRLLHLHFVGNCKTTAGSYSASHKPLQIIFSCYNTRYGNGSSEFSSSCACSLK